MGCVPILFLIEFIYYICSPNKQHVAIEVEYDTATWKEEKVFNTWSPASLLKESLLYKPFFYSKDSWIRTMPFPSIEIESELNIDGIVRRFNLVPHEEVISMGQSNDMCKVCAFLYQPPVAIQSFLRQNRYTIDLIDIKQVPTPTDGICGTDTIGMLIHSDDDFLTYHFNCASHLTYSRNFRDRDNKGVNATNWQVACGVYVGIEILPYVKPGVYTMSDLAKTLSSRIERELADLGFLIENREFHSQEIGWEKILDVLQ
jgi:hypothetical protein